MAEAKKQPAPKRAAPAKAAEVVDVAADASNSGDNEIPLFEWKVKFPGVGFEVEVTASTAERAIADARGRLETAAEDAEAKAL